MYQFPCLTWRPPLTICYVCSLYTCFSLVFSSLSSSQLCPCFTQLIVNCLFCVCLSPSIIVHVLSILSLCDFSFVIVKFFVTNLYHWLVILLCSLFISCLTPFSLFSLILFNIVLLSLLLLPVSTSVSSFFCYLFGEAVVGALQGAAPSTARLPHRLGMGKGRPDRHAGIFACGMKINIHVEFTCYCRVVVGGGGWAVGRGSSGGRWRG